MQENTEYFYKTGFFYKKAGFSMPSRRPGRSACSGHSGPQAGPKLLPGDVAGRAQDQRQRP